MFFAYGEAELACLRAKDKRLCEVIDKIGHVDRGGDTELFSASRSRRRRRPRSGSGCRTHWAP